MKIVTAADVALDHAWAAIDLARIADATVRLHWTDEPYVWHTNDEHVAHPVGTARILVIEQAGSI